MKIIRLKLEATERKYAVDSWEFYLGLAILFIILAGLKFLFPTIIPFDLFQFWKINLDFTKLKEVPWPLLFFGPGVTIVSALLTKNKQIDNKYAEKRLTESLVRSFKAGTFEEMDWRWLFFYYLIIAFSGVAALDAWFATNQAMVTIGSMWYVIILGNLLFGGIAILILANNSVTSRWLNIAALILLGTLVLTDIVLLSNVIIVLVKTWYVWAGIPFVEWISLGQLHQYLFAFGWPIGAAIASSNWNFSEGHQYQGCLGWINSYIVGLFMFWFMFTFGLPIAILVHISYDVIIDIIVYLDRVNERRLGIYTQE